MKDDKVKHSAMHTAIATRMIKKANKVTETVIIKFFVHFVNTVGCFKTTVALLK